ncbi:MAG TPA: hypothetical protein VNK95_16030 [Caldilineaceae bacterium]|nr:hypothetical protein [Caldilineaceae bacterium]
MARPAPPASSAESAWQAQRVRWTAYYEQHLQDRLRWAKHFIAERHRQPARLKAHVASLFALLRQARARPAFHPLAVEVIAALHPWPGRWGRWSEWEEALCWAVAVCAQAGWPAQQARFLGELAHILFYTGRPTEAAEVGQGAIALAQQHGEALALAYGGTALVASLVIAGQRAAAQATLARLLDDALVRAPCEPAQARAAAMLRLKAADLQRRQGNLEAAVAAVSEVIALLERLAADDAHLLAHAHRDRSVMALALGDYDLAAADLDRAQALFAQAEELFGLALVFSSRGLLAWNRGDLVEAEAAIRQGIALTEQVNAQWHLVHEIGNLGLVYLCQGELHRALQHFEQQRVMAAQLGEVKEAKRAIGNRGVARLHLGDYAEAKADLEEELAFFGGQAYQAYVGCTLVNLSWCSAALGNQERALALAEAARALGEQTGSLALRIVALRCLAECLSPQARAAPLRQALALARGRRRFDEAACLLSLAGTVDDEAERAVLWQEGRRLLEAMQATAWVAQRQPHQPPRLPLLY